MDKKEADYRKKYLLALISHIIIKNNHIDKFYGKSKLADKPGREDLVLN